MRSNSEQHASVKITLIKALASLEAHVKLQFGFSLAADIAKHFTQYPLSVRLAIFNNRLALHDVAHVNKQSTVFPKACAIRVR